MMKDLIVEKTQSTPGIYFSVETDLQRIQGESFPENSAKFYAPVVEWVKNYIQSLDNQKSVFEFEIVYFNSSTSKVLMTIFDMLEEAVQNNKDITVHWICDERNDTAIECGEEFKEDLSDLPFNIVLTKGQ